MPNRKQNKSQGIKSTRTLLVWALILPAVLLVSAFAISRLEYKPAMAACSVAAPKTAMGYEQLLRNTKQNGRWYHGDYGQSIALPNGSRLWAFGDTTSGTVNADGTQNRGNQIVNNTAILTTKGCSSVLIGANDSAGKPTAWIKPTGALDHPNLPDYYWLNTPFMDGGTLRIFLSHMHNDASGFHGIGTDIATVDVSRSTPRVTSVTKTPSSLAYDKTPTWGAAVLQSGGYNYIYGNLYKHETWVFGHDYYVARVPVGKTTTLTSWRYWNGSSWVVDPLAAQPVISGHAGVGSGATVYAKSSSEFIMIAKKYDIVGTDIVAWKASSPTGPWTEAKTLVAPIPNINAPAGEITYLSMGHPTAVLSSGNLLVSWSLNSNDAGFLGDPRYGIYFTEVAKP